MNLILGEGLGLRLPTRQDRERWLELFHDFEQLRFGTPAIVAVPGHVDELDERVAEAHRKYDAQQPTTFVVVTEEDPDTFLGTASWYFHAPPPLQVADVGYSVHPDARGHGIATRSLRLLTRWLLTDVDGPGVARVQLDHSVENPASCHVASNAGFAQEGVRTRFLPLRDASAPAGVRRHDVCLHGLAPRA